MSSQISFSPQEPLELARRLVRNTLRIKWDPRMKEVVCYSRLLAKYMAMLYGDPEDPDGEICKQIVKYSELLTQASQRFNTLDRSTKIKKVPVRFLGIMDRMIKRVKGFRRINDVILTATRLREAVKQYYDDLAHDKDPEMQSAAIKWYINALFVTI